MNPNGTDAITIIPAKRDRLPSEGSACVKRVAAYCRVSTEEESQQNSYATQISYYTEYINSHIDWQLAGIFADEGLSGTRTKNRTQFNNMIRLARRHKIDLILCKSISRFARNTVDCLDYVRELKALGVTVIFEKEHINTDEISSEFAISLYASFAQAESESISKNVTWGIEKSFREGHVPYRLQRTLGYRLNENGRPVIIEEEAAVVREIFRLFVEGHSPPMIAQYLTQNAVPRKNGQTTWNRNHIYQILKNEKYAGDAILQKTYTVNCLTHERAKNTGQRPMVLVQDCHDAIIDRRTYDIVRLELEKRRRKPKRSPAEKSAYQTKYCLSRLLVCPLCGSTYKRTVWVIKGQKIGVWRCRRRLEGKGCSRSPSYHEDTLHTAILSAVRQLKQQMNQPSRPADTEAADGTEQNRWQADINALLMRLSEIENERDAILADVNGYMLEPMSQFLRELNQQESEIADNLEALRRQKEESHRQQLCAETARQLLDSLEPPDTFEDILMEKILLKVEAVSKKEIYVFFQGGYHLKMPLGKS